VFNLFIYFNYLVIVRVVGYLLKQCGVLTKLSVLHCTTANVQNYLCYYKNCKL